MSDAKTKVYDVNQIAVTFFGRPISKGRGKTGAAQGAFIEIEPDGPSFTYKKGVDGSLVRQATNEPLTKVRVHLLRASGANAIFSAMLNKDINSLNGDGIGTGAIADLRGASLFETETCWVSGPPTLTYSGEDEEMVWEIHCSDCTRFDGGN